MNETRQINENKMTYRIESLSCAHCANIFENNVKSIDGVKDASVNFGALKIEVIGNVTIQELEKAGAFENIKLRNEDEDKLQKQPFYKQYNNIKVFIATVILLISWMLGYTLEPSNQLPIIGYLASMIIGGYSLFIQGFRNIFKMIFDMNTLMTIAIVGAALIGEWQEGAMVVILFAISEALEDYSVDKARESISSLISIAPNEALIKRNGQANQIPVEDIQIDDIMIVKPGEKLAMDGVVESGSSSVNQAAITGESALVSKEEGDEVFAGTLNDGGLLEVRVTKLVDDTTLSRIIHLVEDAQAERAPAQAFVDKFAKYYTPFIIILALLVAVVPPLLYEASWETWIYQGLAVLVVGCPCALVISTPVAIVTAIGNAARHGVLIKGGIYLEEVGHLEAIAFDKTGTLTEGVPSVTDMISLSEKQEQDLALLAALEKGSGHPLASAILNKADEVEVAYKDIELENFQSLTGKGLKASIQHVTYYVGSPSLFKNVGTPISKTSKQHIEALQSEGKTVILLGTQEKVMMIVAVADKVRPVAVHTIELLNNLGLETVMLTGDNDKTAQVVGESIGVRKIQSELMPEDKLETIKTYTSNNKRISMVGDGVNDAPALAASSLGIAMGGAGTDTAIETADIVLMSDDLSKLDHTIRLSQKTLAIIKQNITFALGLKIIALLLVVPGWLTLWIAVFSDIGATLLVTMNSLRLLKTN